MLMPHTASPRSCRPAASDLRLYSLLRLSFELGYIGLGALCARLIRELVQTAGLLSESSSGDSEKVTMVVVCVWRGIDGAVG